MQYPGCCYEGGAVKEKYHRFTICGRQGTWELWMVSLAIVGSGMGKLIRPESELG